MVLLAREVNIWFAGVSFSMRILLSVSTTSLELAFVSNKGVLRENRLEDQN